MIVGDWNMEPDVINEAWMPDALRARVVATEDARGTHRHANGYSNLDYFLARADLAEAITDVRVAWDAHSSPHKALRNLV